MDSTRLADYQARAAAMLPDTLDIVRTTRVADGSLGQTETEATPLAAVACRVIEVASGTTDREYESMGMMRGEGTHVVRVPVATDVRSADVLVWNGHRLAVSRVMARSMATVLSIACTEVT